MRETLVRLVALVLIELLSVLTLRRVRMWSKRFWKGKPDV